MELLLVSEALHWAESNVSNYLRPKLEVYTFIGEK